MPEPHDSDALNELVQECADKWPDEGPQVLDRLCADHPDHATALKRRVALLQRSGLLEPTAHAAPRRLGEFVLRNQLGSGGMGVVYRAVQESLHREVALKVIRPDHSFFAESRQRFLREVNAVARLQHPGIVPVHMVGEDEGVLYYAMDLVQGCTLAQVLAHLHNRDPATLTGDDLTNAVASRSPTARARVDHESSTHRLGGTWVEGCLRLALHVADALEHAHNRGVLHRDVKPSNVMLTPSGRVLLLDFGLASTNDDPRITRSGAELGSLAYMAPEQVRGEIDSIAATTDVYATGVLLYEILTLSQPFARNTAEATRQAILAGNPAPARTRNRALAADAASVCQKATDPDPARRYQRAQDLARDLGNVLELRPIEARPPGAWLRMRRATQRHPARALSIVFVAILLIGVFPALYLQQRAARLDLMVEKQRTDDALADVKVALARAQAEEQRARWSLGKAREAVDHFLADIGQFRAVDIPVLEELRRDTLQQAAALYEQLQQDRDGATDPDLVRDHALTLFSLAQVLRELDRNTEAEPVLRRVIESFAHRTIDTADRTSRRLLAAAQSSLGAVLLGLNQHAEAETLLADATTCLRQLFAEAPSPELQDMLLRNALALASLRRQQKRVDEATELLEEAIALGEGLAPRIDVLRILADAHAGMAKLLTEQSDAGGAEALYVKALALRRDIAARAPTSARFRRELAANLEQVAILLQSWRPGKMTDALMHIDESAALHAELVRDFPRQFAYRVGYSRSRLLSATMRQQLDHHGDAERDMRDAIDNLEQVRAEIPLEDSWRTPLGFALYSLARHYHNQDRDIEAAEVLDQGESLVLGLLAQKPANADLLQQHAELLLARSEWQLVPTAEALDAARTAFRMGLGFLLDHGDDPSLRGTAFRCFDHLIELLFAHKDVEAMLSAADTYRDANPYKWLSQLTLARTYLRSRTLLTGNGADARQQHCLDEARRAVLRAGEHSLKAVLRIEADPEYAPLLTDSDVRRLLARARAAPSDG